MRRNLFLAALVVLTISCSDESGPDASSQTTTKIDVSPTTIVDLTTTSVVATTVDDGIVRISVTVGVDSGPDRVEELTIGESVELTIVNPDADDEFHVHGFDLGGDETPAGEEKVFVFTATEAGDFEVESHVTGEVLVVIRVS